MSEDYNFQIETVLSGFGKVSLQDIETKDLLSRQDKKYVFHSSLLPEILDELSEHYCVLAIDNKSIFKYRTVYYDTENFEFFLQHHNGKLNRNKVRSRYYFDANKTFFEIKSKSNKEKTVKKRVLIGEGDDGIIDFNALYGAGTDTGTAGTIHSLLEKNLITEPQKLIPQLAIYYTRITLLHFQEQKKITLDYDLSVFPITEDRKPGESKYSINTLTGNNSVINSLVIAETKQSRLKGLTEFEQVMYKMHIRSTSISKYCTGLILMKPEIKHNRFKKRINYIHKIGRIANGL